MDKAINNLLLNEQEIKNRKVLLKSYPKRLIATLSTKCNSRCIMCEVVKNQWDMPKQTIEEIKFLLPYMQSVNWQGGEVFLLNSFRDLFSEALKNKSLKQTIVSNGMLLDDEWIDLLTEADMELTISVDGLDKQTYEKIRFGSKYDVLINNINKLNNIRKKKNSKLILKMHTVVMKSNYKDADKFIDFAKKYNFDIVYMMPIWGGQKIDENIYIGDNHDIIRKLSEEIKIAGQKSKEYGINFFHSIPVLKEESVFSSHDPENISNDIKIESEEIKQNDLFCYLPWQQINIDPGGDIRPGCLCSKVAGNIMNDSILDIWNNQQMQEYRKRILSNPRCWCNADCINNNIGVDLRRV